MKTPLQFRSDAFKLIEGDADLTADISDNPLRRECPAFFIGPSILPRITEQVRHSSNLEGAASTGE